MLGLRTTTGNPDAPTGAVVRQRVTNQCSLVWRLYHRTQLHESGPDYCAKVVDQLAAPGILPVVGVPELIALSYL